MNLFEKFNLNPKLLTTIERLGFSKPTQIQEKSIPYILEGKDLIGESATGSGKTLAFGCGIVERVIPNKGLQALVLTPTRELAEQVKESLKDFSNKHLKTASIYGGVAIGPQIGELARAEVVVATPGRLLDHLQRKTVNLSKINLLVLDEADRMLDMGFIEPITQIIHVCPIQRQTLCFSATIPPDIKKLANRYMNKPVIVSAIKFVDPKKLKQVYYNISRNMKFSLLVHLLQHEKSELVMIFCNTRRTVDFVAKNLQANKIRAIAIHGGLAQNNRTKIMRLFNDAKNAVLVCTDVAARGLHIENVSHIYNYELPNTPKDYVHRIGRTARAGEEGRVINLLCEYDHDNFTRILREYRSFEIKPIGAPYLKIIRTISTNRPRREWPRRNEPDRHQFRQGKRWLTRKRQFY